ncbi:MAG: DUF2817 domain-containing protein [Planctomycetota bacterium]|nr:MAG: DUF2817 domain-containing protein [Planctomycetota bacterium]
MNPSELFSPDYFTARERFRQAAIRLGWQLETQPIDAVGPQGEVLTIDVGLSVGTNSDKVLVVSSGLHGVEGLFGSAVQLALLEHWAEGSLPAVRCVFFHGLNPYGFAWQRRFDESNVDPNRNFLLEGERYEGAPPGYAELNGLLNPRRPPSRWEPFTLKALWAIARFGMPALRQAIASGQYDYPQGLFFGGSGPTQTNRLLERHLPRWLDRSRHVVHLDFHTGLGPRGTCKLLMDSPLTEEQHRRMTDWFGARAFEACESDGIAYQARGGLGRWCTSRNPDRDYLFACAEFGTYGPVQVLAGLRAENQVYHWGTRTTPTALRTGIDLQELFCPSDEAWRLQVLKQSLTLVQRSIQGLAAMHLDE